MKLVKGKYLAEDHPLSNEKRSDGLPEDIEKKYEQFRDQYDSIVGMLWVAAVMEDPTTSLCFPCMYSDFQPDGEVDTTKIWLILGEEHTNGMADNQVCYDLDIENELELLGDIIFDAKKDDNEGRLIRAMALADQFQSWSDKIKSMIYE